MKAISVYALTREQNIHHLQKLERQLSERDYFLKIKEWELNSMKGLVKQLEGHMKEVYALRFFYSFQIPKLGKEFDIQDYLINTENNPEAFFKGCVEEDLGDGSLVRRALGEMAKAKGMVQLAKETGLSKQCLYRALSPEGSPKFETIFRISKALKLTIPTHRA